MKREREGDLAVRRDRMLDLYLHSAPPASRSRQKVKPKTNSSKKGNITKKHNINFTLKKMTYSLLHTNGKKNPNILNTYTHTKLP